MSKSKLKGFCNKCGYGEVCLGGCPNTRLTFNKDIYSENNFCMYNMAIKKAKAKVSGIDNKEELIELGKTLLGRNEYQLAELVYARAMEFDDKDIDIYNNYGYISYMLTNYEDARKANEQALLLDPDNVYANKGMGLTLVKLEEVEEGLKFLRKSAAMTDAGYMYPYYDLALTLIEQNRSEEAKGVIKEAKAKAPEFSSFESMLINAMKSSESAS